MSDVLNRLIEKIENKYYGKYRATVSDNKDPKDLGRLKLIVPELLGEKNVTGWALPCLPSGGFTESGFFFIPEINSNVWVEFEAGNISYPIWTGTWWDESKNKKITEAKVVPDNNIKILKTRSGHKIEFSDNDKDKKENITIESGKKHQLQLDDTDGDEKIQIKSTKGHLLLIDDANEKIQIKSVKGHSFLIDDSGSKIDIKTSKGCQITMDDGGPGKITMKDPGGDIIEMDGGGKSILIKSGMSISIESGMELKLKGADVKIESGGMMTVKASGILTIQGSMVMIN